MDLVMQFLYYSRNIVNVVIWIFSLWVLTMAIKTLFSKENEDE